MLLFLFSFLFCLLFALFFLVCCFLSFFSFSPFFVLATTKAVGVAAVELDVVLALEQLDELVVGGRRGGRHVVQVEERSERLHAEGRLGARLGDEPTNADLAKEPPK